MPDLNDRLTCARQVPGVLDLRDVRIWAVDEQHATGSLVVIARAEADAQLVVRLVKRVIEGGPITDLTVAIEQDD